MYLIYFQFNVLRPVGGDETPDLCKSMYQFISPHHVGKTGKPHQEDGKVVSGKNLFVNLVFLHDLKSAAHPGCGTDRNTRHIDGVYITVNCAGR